MTTIVDVYAREILDSRGNPTVEVDVHTESGASSTAQTIRRSWARTPYSVRRWPAPGPRRISSASRSIATWAA